MPAIIIFLLWVLVIILLAVGGFWLVAQVKFPEPAALVARIIVCIVVVYLFLGLFVPSLGVHFPGLK